MDESSVCLAGVPKDSTSWIRPTTTTHGLSHGNVHDRSGNVVQPLDLVEFDLVRRAPSAPHVEDWLADFRRPVRILGHPDLSVRQSVLERAVESSPDPVLVEKKRSLILVEPDRIESAVFDPSDWGEYKVRLSFVMGGSPYTGESSKPGYPCTDLKLRAWGRRFRRRTELNDIGLRKLLQTERIFLALGLARLYQGKYWPMVVGFHTLPDFQASIDLRNP